jgi:hypothetical protein
MNKQTLSMGFNCNSEKARNHAKACGMMNKPTFSELNYLMAKLKAMLHKLEILANKTDDALELTFKQCSLTDLLANLAA